MAFYKCLPIKPIKKDYIKNGEVLDGYVRTFNSMTVSRQGIGARFTPVPNGGWNSIVFNTVIPAKAKKIVFYSKPSIADCGFIGVSTKPNSWQRADCIKSYSLKNEAVITLDISDIDQPVYLMVSCYYWIEFGYIYAE